MVYKAKNIKIGKNINLDKEVVLLANGQRLTEKRAQKIAKEVTQSHAGRPSLSRPRVTSPEVKARVPEKLKKALEREAKRRGETPSALIREALEKFLKSA
jgi:predicted nucleic acid-binding Zn ribbon protein